VEKKTKTFQSVFLRSTRAYTVRARFPTQAHPSYTQYPRNHKGKCLLSPCTTGSCHMPISLDPSVICPSNVVSSSTLSLSSVSNKQPVNNPNPCLRFSLAFWSLRHAARATKDDESGAHRGLQTHHLLSLSGSGILDALYASNTVLVCSGDIHYLLLSVADNWKYTHRINIPLGTRKTVHQFIPLAPQWPHTPTFNINASGPLLETLAAAASVSRSGPDAA